MTGSPEPNDIPQVFETVADAANKEVTRMKNEAQQAEALEQAQNGLDEMKEIAQVTHDYFGVLVAQGFPPKVAHEMVIGMSDAYWAESMRKAFRGGR